MFACLHAKGELPEEVSLLEFAYSYAPLLEEISQSTVLIDLQGCELLQGHPSSVARAIHSDAERAGIRLSVAVSRNPDAAYLMAANQQTGVVFIPPGQEARYLGGFPITAIDLSLSRLLPKRQEEIRKTLDSWGIETLRQLMELPEKGLVERFGEDGLRLRQLASGTHRRALKYVVPETQFKERRNLEDPLENLEGLVFVLGSLFARLCEKMQKHGRAASSVSVTFELEISPPVERSQSFPVPICDAKTLLRLWMLNLESRPLGDAVTGIEVSAQTARQRSSQHNLFQRSRLEPEKLELTLARVAAIVGPENVGSPEVLDTHRPDAYKINRFRWVDKPLPKANRSAIPLLAFRAFRPPIAARVYETAGRIDRIAAQMPRKVYGHVNRISGPWRISGEWWSGNVWIREEWDIALSDGNVYRIFQDMKTHAWYIEGVYD